MLFFSRWKAAAILLTALVVCLFAVPNFFPESAIASWPAWAQRHIVLGLDLQGGSHILLEVDTNAVRKEQAARRCATTCCACCARRGFSFTGRARSAATASRCASRARATIPQRARPSCANFRSRSAAFSAAPDSAASTSPRRRRPDPAHAYRAGDHRAHSPGGRSVDPDHRAARQRARPGRADRSSARAPTAFWCRCRACRTRRGSRSSSARPPSSTSAWSTCRCRRAGACSRPRAGRTPKSSKARRREEPYLVEKRVLVSGDDLIDAQPGFDQRNGEPIVSFRFNSTGARNSPQVTQQNVGKPFAIVLDNKVISAPVIREPILGGSGQISGNFTVEQANDLAILLRAGALPAPLTVVEERTVGPGLGQDSINAGEHAAYVGAALVVIFMLVTYGLFGLFANLAVAVNVAMIFGVLSLLSATLTLARHRRHRAHRRHRGGFQRAHLRAHPRGGRAPAAPPSTRSMPASPARSPPSSTPTSPPSSPPRSCSISAPGRCAALP